MPAKRTLLGSLSCIKSQGRKWTKKGEWKIGKVECESRVENANGNIGDKMYNIRVEQKTEEESQVRKIRGGLYFS